MFQVRDNQIHVVGPATGKLIGKFPIDNETIIERRLDQAEQGFEKWKGLSFKERGKHLLKVRDVIYEKMDEIAKIISDVTGKPIVEAITAEIVPLLAHIPYFVKRAPKILSEHRLPLHLLKYKKSFLRYEPIGVIAVISPWNYPFWIPMADIVMALLAGNSIILKTSEAVLPVAKAIEDIFKLANVPKGIVNVSYGNGKTGSYIVSSPRIKKIVFTGSTAVGRKIMEQASKNITPCILELGGKDAAIVCKDANLKKAAKGITWGAFTNAGQVCTSIERVYVERSVAQPFVEHLIKEIESLKIGKDVGAITIPSQIERYQSQLENAMRGGAKILIGGMPEKRDEGNYFQPTAIINVTQDMDIMQEETFGPLLPIMMVDSTDEAINLANDSKYGLGASIWTRRVKKGIQMARKIESGTVTINDSVFTAALPEAPWGGVKSTGMGRVHSDIGLKEFVQVKHVNYELLPLPAFWWFPYTEKSYKTAKAFAGILGEPTIAKKAKSAATFLKNYLLPKV